MEPAFQSGRGIFRLMPVIVENPQGIGKIFPAPVDNSVGTNELDNAISILRLDSPSAKVREIRRNFRKYVSVSDNFFLPVFDGQFIGYTQKRSFVLFNVVGGGFEAYLVGGGVPDEITYNAAALEPESRLFVFDMCRADIYDYEWVLKVMRLSGGEEKTLGERTLGRKKHKEDGPWCVAGNLVYAFDMINNELLCLDSSLSLRDHPLTQLYRRESERIGPLAEILVHSHLPFAVMVSRADTGSNGLWLARWEHPDAGRRFVPLFSGEDESVCEYRVNRARDFQFSPDGKWMVFRDEDNGRDNPLFVAVPVVLRENEFPGDVVILGRGAISGKSPLSTAWVSSPQSFVSCDGYAFFKWELNVTGP